MANLSALIDYEREHAVKIKNPNTGEELGITINVVSADSKRVSGAVRKLQVEFDKLEVDGNPMPVRERMQRIEREILIESISSWSWGDNEWDSINGDSECNRENKEYLVDHPNSQWLVGQVAEGTAKIENFTQESSKPVRNTSKKK